MGKVKAAAKKWVKQAWKDVKKDPEVISRTIDRAEKRIKNVSNKAKDTVMKAKGGDLFGAAKAAHNTYKAAIGAKKHGELLMDSKAYRRAHNIGSKTFKAAEAFDKGDHAGGYKHAMDAARAAIGKAKLEEIKSYKASREALAAIHGFKKASGLPSEASAIKKLEAGISGYVEKKKQQKEKMIGSAKPQLLGRNG
jgi:hypothetical protein